jgi:hypothetical protein
MRLVARLNIPFVKWPDASQALKQWPLKCFFESGHYPWKGAAMRKTTVSKVFLAVVVLATATTYAQELEFKERSVERIEGRLPGLGIEFSSEQRMPDFTILEVRLPGGVLVRAEIDYLLEEVSLRSLSDETGMATPLGPGDPVALARLLDALMLGLSTPHEDALARTLSFLAPYPAGSVVDVESAKAKRAGGDKAITSLCSSTGKQRSGKFDVKDKVFNQTVQVGPCYSQTNECMGRCGPGCGAPPHPTIQVFAQDCLNHDLCTRKTGTIFGECTDEWNAAIDDFTFGRDCGDLDGTWTDAFQYSWKLNQGTTVTGSVKGAGTESHCLSWSVSGLHTGANVSFNASRLFQREGCCRSFSLTGKATSCNAANGRWTNACGLRGSWSMSRRGKSAVFEFLGDEDPEAGPGAARE